jgi:predicted ABC-type transport system involved in lysophospholipase L1 biosynthesis ATPase subunit
MCELLRLDHVFKGVTRGGQWSRVLEDVGFTVQPGEVVAILGGRLSGKTTLLRIAAGIERPDEGNVLLAGQPLAKMSERSRARLLGHEIVWIDRAGPGLDVEVSRFVGWPLALHGHRRRETERKAKRALERVGAEGCIGRSWAELSNWQRVLVGLARAFAGTPGVVVIDDLLDVLGSRASEEASDLVHALLEESELPCCVVMSVSNMDSAVVADRMFSLTRKGEVKLLSGQPGIDAEIIPLRKHAGGEGCSA